MADRDIVAIGLPCAGLRKLTDHFNMRRLEHDAWTSPDAARNPKVASMRASLEGCLQPGEGHRTLIIYQTPWGFLERETVKAPSQPEQEATLETFARNSLGLWHAFYGALLGLHRKHGGCCLLFNGDRPFEPGEIARLVEERFGLRLSPHPDPAPNSLRNDSAIHEAAWCQIVDALAPECADLYAEMESCAELMGRQPELEFGGFGKRDAHVAAVLRLLASHRRIESVLQRHGIDTHDADSALENELSARKKEAEQHALQIRQFEQMRGNAGPGERQIESLKKENELYLLQLHQLQEDLQHHLKLNRESERTRARLEQIDRQREQQLRELQKELHRQSEPVSQKIFRKIFNRDTPAHTAETTAKVSQDRGHQDGRRALEQEVIKIRSSGLFDEKWYLRTYPDVAIAGIDPIEHYLQFGSSEGRNPSAHFDTLWYTKANVDVTDARMNPLLHYVLHGKAEGRPPMPVS